MKRVIILNGPNLNLIGQRETSIYGDTSIKDIEERTSKKINSLFPDVELTWFQTNDEYELVTKVQEAPTKYKGLIINPGALSHTSIALHDALLSVDIKKIEVHLSNTHKRESFRSHRITAKSCDAVLEGLGKDVYYLGIISLLDSV